ncbi:MAG TPA: acyltransferase [Novosphingobium capsulatum]|nr:acyltransferase [Novosphingobium capsulatum]
MITLFVIPRPGLCKRRAKGATSMQADHRGRYALLDDMRGIAAVAVCLFHIGTRAGGLQLFPNGYLAVDFFFMLSGFVLAEAYENRLRQSMSLTAFIRRRTVRMAPVAMLGATIGGVYLLARWSAAPDRSDPLVEVVMADALNLVLLPKLWHGRATGWELFPANGPLWSLFFEILANLAWAAWMTRASTRMLAGLTLLAAAALTASALHHGSLHIGWQVPTLDGGLARISFGFGCGLLMHRLRHRIPPMKAPAAPLAALALVYALALPEEHLAWTLFVALVFLPGILAVSVTAGRHRAMPGGALLGRLSYPLYGIHVPLLAIAAGGIKRITGGMPLDAWGLLLLPPILMAAWLTLILFDEPLRAFLSQRPPRGFRSQAPGKGVAAGPSTLNLSGPAMGGKPPN